MKTDVVFKRTFNDALTILSGIDAGMPLPSESVLGRRLGVSRTTVRKVLAELDRRGLVASAARQWVVVGPPGSHEKYPDAETITQSAQLEHRFMEWLLRDNAVPGTTINELELARHFGIATTGIREFLNRFQQYGLIEKRPNSGWVFRGFTLSFALELFEIREMFEVRSARALVSLPDTSVLWRQVEAMRREHEELLRDIHHRFHDFSELDNRFHKLINSAQPNRFVDRFYDLITLIFHYHYQWNKQDERERNEVAIGEHLTYIDALLSRNKAMVDLACKAHLTSARETLIRSTSRAVT